MDTFRKQKSEFRDQNYKIRGPVTHFPPQILPRPKENVIIFLKTCDLFAEKPYIIIKKF